MSVRIIAEIGSCHMGKLEYAKEAIDRCADVQVDAIKFQLFPNDPSFTDSGNVWLNPEHYLELIDYAKECEIEIGASCFDEDSFEFLLKTEPRFIKFAHSQKHRDRWIRKTLEHEIEAIVSCDVMSEAHIPKGATKLFCLPYYPVYYQVCFQELFPRFDGFSDHTLGFDQTLEAIYSGALIIEKHIRLTHADVTCPDAAFALNPYELNSMVACIRKIEKDGVL